VIRESWLAEIAPDSPCGKDLEYDQDFLALERAARGKEEQQYGDTVIPPEEPVWADVVERATALLERTRDLRVVHLLARGLVRTRGLPGLVEGLELARRLLDTFWEPLHPSLLFEGEPDPVVRMNAIAALAASDGLVRDVRAAEFLRTAAVTLTVQDALNIVDRSTDGIGIDQLKATLVEILAADATALSEMPAALEHVNAIRSRVLAHIDTTFAPDMAPLVAVVKPLAALVDEARARARPQEDPAAEGSAAPGAAPITRASGDIHSRDDALRALDRVCEFLARNEPTNPAPLLIRRAQRIMTMPFLDIIRELAPDATGQVETITGAGSQS
jgi:type VI secretion system protein ImpA